MHSYVQIELKSVLWRGEKERIVVKTFKSRSDENLIAALAMAQNNQRVIPVHGVIEGKCTCWNSDKGKQRSPPTD